MSTKIGLGYDIHRLEKGKKLILGGVDIPFEKGLAGHSDADVLIHAICDALLGALGKGDIGEMFPNTDDQYKNCSSLVFLEKIAGIIEAEGFKVGNIDAMIQAEEPKISEYKSQMKFHIAYKLAIDEKFINIKATTQEKLGAIGKGEGIAAFATVLLEGGL